MILDSFIMRILFETCVSSDELLLQDDSSDVNNMTVEFSKSMHLNQESFVGAAGRFNQMSTQR